MRHGVFFWLAVGSVCVAANWACGGSDGGGRANTNSSGGTNTSGGMTAGGSTGSTAGNSSSGSTSGGSGGGAPVCNPTAGPMKGDGTNLTIDDIDDDNLMFMTAGVGTGAWDFSKDTSTGTITPTGTATLVPETGGQAGTGLHVAGTGLTGWGAALGAFLNGATSAFDASSYGGIAFYVKGTATTSDGANKIMVLARMPDVLPGAGTCCSDAVAGAECYSAHRAVVTLTADWTEVKLPWSSFAGPTWGLGATLAFNPNRVRDITFSFNHDAMTMMPADGATFDVWIDGLRFMSADEMGGTGGSSSGGTGGTSGGGGTSAGGDTSGEGGAGGG